MYDDSTIDYASSFDVIAPGFSAAIEGEQAQSESWIDAAARLIPILVVSDQQRKLLEIQTDRARQGLPPLQAADYAPGVRVGLTDDTTKLVLAGIAALAAVLIIPQLIKPRRKGRR